VLRVNGLAVSRSIGDRKLKNMGQGQIIAVPEYEKVQLTNNNHFMIIASDGLWDVINNEDAVHMVQEQLKKAGNTLKGVAQLLQNEAIARGSGDNITVCVVKFDWVNTINAPKKPSLMTRLWDWVWGTRASDK
jgi:protein phosphatase 1L